VSGNAVDGTEYCDYCGHEGEPDSADYYGAEISVCENCGCEL